MAANSGAPVRFYFGFSVLLLIPPNPAPRRGRAADGGWDRRFTEPLSAEVEGKLSKVGFDVAYRRHAPVDAARRLHAVDFVASAVHRFTGAQISRKEGFGGFKVKPRHLAAAKSLLARRLSDALAADHVLEALAFEYAASRTFSYEVHLEATLRLRHDISGEDARDAGGVRVAIESFASEVDGVVGQNGWGAHLKSSARRPKDGVYEFDLVGTEFQYRDEGEVSGCLALAGKDDLDDFVLADIGGPGDFGGVLTAAEDMLSHLLETEGGYWVEELTLYLIDYEEEPFDYSDDLL